jgi:VWFA-related protein
MITYQAEVVSMKNNWFLIILAVVIVGLLATTGGCKKDDSPTDSGAPSTISANGTLAPTSRTQAQGTLFVSDQDGNPITGLTAANVTASMRWGVAKVSVADSVVGTIILQTLSQSGKNIAAAMTMDYSGSMYSGAIDSVSMRYLRIKNMESAVKTFVSAMGTQDRAEIIKFGSYNAINVVQPFTSDKALLTRAADTLSFDRGNTALYSSIVRGVLDGSALSSSSYARAVIAFTDGGENDSSVPRDSIFRSSRRNAIPVYTVGLLDSAYHSTPPGNYYSERDLVEIADSTGGFYFYAPNAAGLVQIYTRISGQLSNAYTVVVNWPGTGLPPAGTFVTVTITVKYGSLTSTFIRTFTML